MKILIIVGSEVHEYRRELYSGLGNIHDVTIFTEKSIKIPNCNVKLFKTFKIGKIRVQPNVLFEIYKRNYDKIIVVGNFSLLVNGLVLLFGRTDKIICWGFWPTSNILFDFLRAYVIKRGVPQIFYAKSHENYYKNQINANFISITATNTVYVDSLVVDKFTSDNKKHLIFVGSLNKRKGLENTILSLAPLLLKYKIKFIIFGDGSERENLEQLCLKNNVEDLVVFKGGCNDAEILSNFYGSSVCEISPNQAGLSVQRSLAHGVPFITLKTAVSGGEIDSIIDGYSGFKCVNMQSIIGSVELLLSNSHIQKKMCDFSKQMYQDQLTMDNMIKKFNEVIMYESK